VWPENLVVSLDAVAQYSVTNDTHVVKSLPFVFHLNVREMQTACFVQTLPWTRP